MTGVVAIACGRFGIECLDGDGGAGSAASTGAETGVDASASSGASSVGGADSGGNAGAGGAAAGAGSRAAGLGGGGQGGLPTGGNGGEGGAGAGRTLCAGQIGLVACYAIEGTLDDDSGAGNNLTGADLSFGPGVDGQALFVTSSSTLDSINSPSLELTTEITMEAWVNPSEPQNWWFIDHDHQWGMRLLDNGNARCVIVRESQQGNPYETTTISGGTVPVDTWTHVGCAYDGSVLRLYVNGIEVASETGDPPLYTEGTDGFTVGYDGPDGPPFVGGLDSIRVWSRAFSAAEMLCSFEGNCPP